MDIVWFSCDSGPDVWNGKFSKCQRGGEIQQFLKAHGKSVLCIMPKCDGFVRDPIDLVPDRTGINKLNFTVTTDSRHKELEEFLKQGRPVLFALLCTRAYSDPRILYVPFDDEIFSKGLKQVLAPYTRLPWNERKSVAFWRGGCSGHPFIRGDVVKALLGNSHADVKFIRRWHWNHNLPAEAFDEGGEASPTQYMRHKYILILDGGVIASSHMWVFGSGAVPILVSHPDNRYWFHQWLIPGVNCISVGYDMDVLVRVISWLTNHDEEAKRIADAAQALADRIFSAEFQQAYLKSELERLT